MPALTAMSVRESTSLFKALGDETRLRIVALLSHGELCVCHVEAALGLSQPAASRHLSVLRTAGVVEARREGSWVYYRLAPQTDPYRKAQLKTLVGSFAKEKALRDDVAQLLRTRGPRSCK